jgi:hypothetical protein
MPPNTVKHYDLIMIDRDTTRRLNLVDEAIRDKVKGVVNQSHLRQLFEQS